MEDFYVLKVSEIDAAAPTHIQIVPLGLLKDGKGRPFRVTKDDLPRMIFQFMGRKNDLVIDYEHQTLEGVIAPAAGWIKSLENRGDQGLWAVVDWNDNGKKFIEAKEYRYLSPVLFVKKGTDGIGIPQRLHSAALTNDPAIDGMEPLMSKNQLKENEMDCKEIKKLLGLEDSASEEQMLEHISAMKDDLQKKTGQKVVVIDTIPMRLASALDLAEGATVSEAEATVLALKQKMDAGESDKVNKLGEEIAAMKADAAVDLAMKEGKVTASQKDWALGYAKRDLAGFQLFASKATPVVPTEPAPPGDDVTAGQAMDETTIAMSEMFGNTQEDLVKFGGVAAA